MVQQWMHMKYSYVDKGPENGMNYYRLVQIDYNGKNSTSPVRSVRFNNENLALAMVYPNPAFNDQDIFVKINREIDSEGELNLYNQLGQRLATMPLKGINTAEPFQLNNLSLTAGWYIVSIQTPYENKEIKLVIK